jgi:acyl carrier protein
VTNEEALQLIKTALETVCPGSSEDIDTSTDLAAVERLDSLHIMEMLFELENHLGQKIDAIGEDYSDFRVSALIEILTAA